MESALIGRVAVAMTLGSLSSSLILSLSNVAGRYPNRARLCFRVLSPLKRVGLAFLSGVTGISIGGSLVSCVRDGPSLSCGVG